MLEAYPVLASVAKSIDDYLKAEHPTFFGPAPSHPVLPLKRSKILHDDLWGTNRFFWRELALIDSPVFQRLRDILQTGLAFQTYMSARHSRFEHSLGVVTIASRIFDALLQRDGGTIKNIAQAIAPDQAVETTILKLRAELRMAALLHDTGHSLYSHTSERVYSQLPSVKKASAELSRFVGKEKGAGEVLAFCLAQSESVKILLGRAAQNLVGDPTSDEYEGPVDLTNVALMIVGRGPHPFLQFLADIISSGFDADKLDYLFRDATSAGLPLRYDLDRYLYSVRLEKNALADGEGELESLYRATGAHNVERKASAGLVRFPQYDTYRLRLPKDAMNTIEQIVLCKLMLFSYIYHHQKVRAAEGMLEKMLSRAVQLWRSRGEDDERILQRFIGATDSCLFWGLDISLRDPIIKEYAYRIVNRLLPREVYSLGGADASHAEGVLLQSFLTDLQKREKREMLTHQLEKAIGEELQRLRSELAQLSWEEALLYAGVWLDVPKLPKIEDVEELVIGATNDTGGIPLTKVFPVGEWTEAYTHFKYQVRIFAFSEYWDTAATAARKAMEQVTHITGTRFYESVKRKRS